MGRFLILALWAGVLAQAGSVGMADSLPAPQTEVILTVTGQIARTNTPDGAELDLDMLVGMGTGAITTSTIWTQGPQQFEGVYLASLLTALGAQGGAVRVTALNEYTVTIPMADIAPDAPLLAFAMNGTQMSPRDKGPLWIIYPFDERAEYRQDVTYARAIWQLVRIEVLP